MAAPDTLALPPQPTPLERAAGIRSDLERIRSETVDLTAADDLGAVLTRLALLICDLGVRHA